MSARDKLIKLMEEETGYKYIPKTSTKYQFDFLDTDNEWNPLLILNPKYKTYTCYAVTPELHKAIGEYLKEIGWM